MPLAAGPIPLYHQLAEDLRKQIAANVLRPGDAIPSEEKLCERYHVSRITVRRALDDLIAQGLVMRRRGVGTFVAPPRQATRSISLVGSLYEALAYPPNISIEVINRREIMASQRIAESLELDLGAMVTELQVLSRIGELPFADTTFYFPPDIGSGIASDALRAGTPVAHLVEDQLGEAVVRAEQLVEPSLANGRTAELLELAPNTPVLHVWRTYYTANGRPVETVSVLYHPNQYRLRIKLLPGGPGTG